MRCTPALQGFPASSRKLHAAHLTYTGGGLREDPGASAPLLANLGQRGLLVSLVVLKWGAEQTTHAARSSLFDMTARILPWRPRPPVMPQAMLWAELRTHEKTHFDHATSSLAIRVTTCNISAHQQKQQIAGLQAKVKLGACSPAQAIHEHSAICFGVRIFSWGTRLYASRR